MVMTTLVVAVSSLASVMAFQGFATWLEAISFVSGAVCVWLTVKENIWNFPIGLLNVATFSIVFFRARLLADAGLQVVYFILGIMGWYLWLHGGENRSALRVTRAPWKELAILTALVILSTIVLWQTLPWLGGSASFWDALTTSLSLGSQWLLNRKRLESWLGWVLVDTIYIPLYVYKELYLTAILYAVFLGMAAMGYRKWRQSRLADRPSSQVVSWEGAAVP